MTFHGLNADTAQPISQDVLTEKYLKPGEASADTGGPGGVARPFHPKGAALQASNRAGATA